MFQQSYTINVPAESSTVGRAFAPIYIFGFVDILNAMRGLQATGAESILKTLPANTNFFQPPDNDYFNPKAIDTAQIFLNPVTSESPSATVRGYPYSWQSFNLDNLLRTKIVTRIDVTYISRNLSATVPPTDISFAPTVAMLGSMYFSKIVDGKISSNSFNLANLYDPKLFLNPNAKENFTISFDCEQLVDAATSFYFQIDTWIRAYPTAVLTLHYK